MPLREHRVRARLETRTVGDPGTRLHVLVLHQAWRRLDFLPNRLAQGHGQGPRTRFKVFLRYGDRAFPHLLHLWHRAGGHQPNRQSFVCCRQRQRVRRSRAIAIPASISHIRWRERGSPPLAARAQLDGRCRVRRRRRLTLPWAVTDRPARNVMSKLRVQSFAISIDGYGAGPNQDLENPLGVGGPEMMEWLFPTGLWRKMQGHDDGETGIDNGIAEQGFAGIGAWILGRNMFGPVRGPWPDESWKGWWGDEPPYHTPVFVLTHPPRAPLRMAGDTAVRFVTEGIHAALEPATADPGGRDVRVGGGVSTLRQYLRAALIDELHRAVRPVLLGSGEHLLHDLDLRALGYECAKSVAGERATHVFLRRRA